MRLGRAWSVALVGLQANPVEIEVSLGGGLPRTVIVGLPDTSLYEARDRCKAAVGNSGLSWPDHLVTINLSPAGLPKAGTHFDLGIVAAVLAASGEVRPGRLEGTLLMGELGLDGRVRPVRGILPALLASSHEGTVRAVVPVEQVAEAALVSGVEVVGVRALGDLVAWLRGADVDVPVPAEERPPDEATPDLADVAGQLEARWALEVAAAGGHHLYFHGPPGVGKTLLAERLPGILPDLTADEALEVAAVRSLCGLPVPSRLSLRPPFSGPHHSASVASIVGGGARIAQPGAISLAHRGVLFLDEAPEFSTRALEALRTPLESGRIVLARSQAQTTYPANFQLVLAANPCPCGQSGRAGAVCTCSAMAVRRYRERLSGPILDRVDITAHLRPMTQTYLRAAGPGGEPSGVVRDRVVQARHRASHRLERLGWGCNAQVSGAALRKGLPLPEGVDLLDRAVARGQLTARGVDKVVRLAWTIADLAGASRPGRGHLTTALAMRRGDELGGAEE